MVEVRTVERCPLPTQVSNELHTLCPNVIDFHVDLADVLAKLGKHTLPRVSSSGLPMASASLSHSTWVVVKNKREMGRTLVPSQFKIHKSHQTPWLETLQESKPNSSELISNKQPRLHHQTVYTRPSVVMRSSVTMESIGEENCEQTSTVGSRPSSNKDSPMKAAKIPTVGSSIKPAKTPSLTEPFQKIVAY